MRFRFALVAMSLLTALPTGFVAAQDDERMSTITVTASRIDSDDLRAAPAVYLRVPADFVLVGVNYQSASRDASERKKELATMFDRLKAAVAKTPGYTLSGGEIGESSAPIDTVKFSDVYMEGGNRATFSLVLTVDTKPGETFDILMERTEAFIAGVKLAGRAESYFGSEQFIGARGTHAHRDKLLEKIATETTKFRSMFAPAKVILTGLESRVITQPSGPLELEIFIPYTLTLESGSE